MYIVCHMMASIDGRIDCAMTEKLQGVDEYYSALQQLNVPTTVSGRVTAEMEMGVTGRFTPENATPLGKTAFSRKADATGYTVVADTKGVLLWGELDANEPPLLILTSEQVTNEYLSYLDEKSISWVACGKDKIDLAGAVDILEREFGVTRMGIVGGGTVNAGFLDAGLLDEVSMVFGAGIDGRGGMGASFDGRSKEREPVQLTLNSVESYPNGTGWLRYTVQK